MRKGQSGRPAARKHQPILRRQDPIGPADFRGAQTRKGWVIYRWETSLGTVALAYPVDDTHVMTMPTPQLLNEIAADAAALAIVEGDYNIPWGPSLEAIDAAAPDHPYGTTWRRLHHLLGTPAPYWHINLRNPELMAQWRPGAPTLLVPALTKPDPSPLLRLAAEEPDGSHAAIAAVHAARSAYRPAAEDAQEHIARYVEASDDADAIALAARPLMPHQPPEVAEEILRDGWKMILARRDVLAGQCARLGQTLGVTRYFPGAYAITVDPSSCPEAAQWEARLVRSPRTALAIYLGDHGDQDILIDPLTDMPAARTADGNIETLAPERLPTLSPLAALTIAERAVWVRTQDSTVFLAPQRAANYTYGYNGGGPRALARLIDLLLDDITNPAPGFGAEQPPPGLLQATTTGWEGRSTPFTVTRGELRELRGH